MTGRKIDYSMTRNGQLEAVKARIFTGVDGEKYVSLDGAFFNGCELSRGQVLEHMTVMLDLLKQLGGPANGNTST